MRTYKKKKIEAASLFREKNRKLSCIWVALQFNLTDLSKMIGKIEAGSATTAASALSFKVAALLETISTWGCSDDLFPENPHAFARDTLSFLHDFRTLTAQPLLKTGLSASEMTICEIDINTTETAAWQLQRHLISVPAISESESSDSSEDSPILLDTKKRLRSSQLFQPEKPSIEHRPRTRSIAETPGKTIPSTHCSRRNISITSSGKR